MKNIQITPVCAFDTTLKDVASDKSISHRCALFSLLSDKSSTIYNYLQGEDTLSMLKIVELLGAKVQKDDDKITITPPEKIKEPNQILDCQNAGTAIRLLIGFLSSKEGFFVLYGDKYLTSRPMNRIVKPLSDIGACIDGRENAKYSPLCIRGKKLKPFEYKSSISSAQVKTAMILAGLSLDGISCYDEEQLSRDHTEKMLVGMGANLQVNGTKILINPTKKPLDPLDIVVPCDPSSGFFFAVLVALIPNSSIVLENMLLNKTRIEAFKVLQRMGLDINFEITSDKYEKIGTISIKHAPLKAIHVSENISWLIDEIPALAIAFAYAQGTSVVKNASELRVKECDRIKAIVENLRLCGVRVDEYEDGFSVVGGEMKNAKVSSFGDHRIAMSFIIAGLKCGMEVEDIECINTSFPNFFQIVEQIKKAQI